MPNPPKVLGILKPSGGGDPVPLTRESLVVGRRPSCDICLDFEKISGKHCELRFFHGLWHIRDIGSTNGTTVNGMKFATEQSVLPEVEIGIGGHLYTIDYEPAGPSSVVEGSQILDDDIIETRTRKSLMELAGLEVEGPRKSYRPSKAPEQIERPLANEAEFVEDIPDDLPRAKPLPLVEASDDDFFNLIQEDLSPKKK
jgi:predicted component of type VI protein secretion system